MVEAKRGCVGWYTVRDAPLSSSTSNLTRRGNSFSSLGSAIHGTGPRILSVSAYWTVQLPGLDAASISSLTRAERTASSRYSFGAHIASHARQTKLAVACSF